MCVPLTNILHPLSHRTLSHNGHEQQHGVRYRANRQPAHRRRRRRVVVDATGESTGFRSPPIGRSVRILASCFLDETIRGTKSRRGGGAESNRDTRKSDRDCSSFAFTGTRRSPSRSRETPRSSFNGSPSRTRNSSTLYSTSLSFATFLSLCHSLSLSLPHSLSLFLALPRSL